MESWGVVVVGAGPAALRAAIASADSGTLPLMIDESGIGSASGTPPIAGLAASIDELDSSSHREDTISVGGESTDKAAAARACGEAVSTLTELERWGLVLRRREEVCHMPPRLRGTALQDSPDAATQPCVR